MGCCRSLRHAYHSATKSINHTYNNVRRDVAKTGRDAYRFASDPTLKHFTQLHNDIMKTGFDFIGYNPFKGQNKTFKKGYFQQIGEQDSNKVNKYFIQSMLSGVQSYDYESILYNMNQMVISKGTLTNVSVYDSKGYAVDTDSPYVINNQLVKEYLEVQYKYTSLDLKSYELGNKYLKCVITSNQYCGELKILRKYFDTFVKELKFLMLPLYYDYKPLDQKDIMLQLSKNGLTYNSFMKSVEESSNKSDSKIKHMFLTYATSYDDEDYKDIITYIYGTKDDNKDVTLKNKYYKLHYWWKCDEDSNGNKINCKRKATLNSEDLDINSEIYVLPLNLGRYLTIKDFNKLKNKMQSLGVYVTQDVDLNWYQTKDFQTIMIFIQIVVIAIAVVTGQYEILVIMTAVMAADYIIDHSNISPQLKAILKTIVAIVAIAVGAEYCPTGTPLSGTQTASMYMQISQQVINLGETFDMLNEQHKTNKYQKELDKYNKKLEDMNNNTLTMDLLSLTDNAYSYIYDYSFDTIYDYDAIYQY